MTTRPATPSSPPRRGLLVGLAAVPALAAGLFAMIPTADAEPTAQGEARWGARVCAELGCTDEQKEDLRAIFAELRQDGRGDHEALRELRGQMREEFAKDAPDEARLRELQARIATHQGALASRRLEAMLDAHAVLDAEQRVKALEMLDEGGKALRRGRRPSAR